MPLNKFGQPVGEAIDWRPGERLVPTTLTGRTCLLEPLGEPHLEGLYAALCLDSPAAVWTYMPSGPFAGRQAFAEQLERLRNDESMVPLAIVVLPNGTPLGLASYLRVDHANGTAEVGHISLGSALQRTTAATEAIYLMARHAFDVIGVRRFEWKCDSLNEPSRRAAQRLGFTYEGTFRSAVVYKGRNRDTAWFAITDEEWPGLRSGFERWLDPGNFDDAGRQRAPLSHQAELGLGSDSSSRQRTGGYGSE